ncbi:MAG TPA: flagellar basal body P-ring protein FlgI [Fimbriimonadaceae bacterium]|nr:flagellar basal body P-ring protein FlgI [Fimbriimonadaceae bacterium]
MKTLSLILILAASLCLAQQPAKGGKPAAKPQVGPAQMSQEDKEAQRKYDDIVNAEKNGIEARIKGIAHFRGIRSNQLMGTGLVVGLAGTGDSKKSIVTQQIIANMFKEFGIKLDPAQLDMKNIAAVMVTADLPPFATNGQMVDVEVQSIGDAKSLVGGTLLQTALYAAGDQSTVYVSAQGPMNVGGFDISAGGSSAKKGFVTAGRVPEGGIVERGAATKLVYDGKIYLDLNQPDLTTAMRVASKINENYPKLNATAINGGSIEITLPPDLPAMEAMSRIEELWVFADTQETIVINEKTGTIVIGGNVRVGPAAIVQGSLNVKIDQDVRVSQPEAFSNGNTVVTQKTTIDVDEPKADVASFAPNTTVADLAKVFHALQLKASDVIAILQALREQGALKARIIPQ